MSPLNLELDLELNLDVDKVKNRYSRLCSPLISYKVFNYLVRLLRNRNITQYIKNHPATYNEVLVAVQEIP
jgi:hypothetical protein